MCTAHPALLLADSWWKVDRIATLTYSRSMRKDRDAERPEKQPVRLSKEEYIYIGCLQGSKRTGENIESVRAAKQPKLQIDIPNYPTTSETPVQRVISPTSNPASACMRPLDDLISFVIVLIFMFQLLTYYIGSGTWDNLSAAEQHVLCPMSAFIYVIY